ncbi:hypothetical protein ILP97_01560 [Amycolatopsis sp. H6(2020)]|nr:hypothetical protein [Amycolatopsis sp. H6(2020)]
MLGILNVALQLIMLTTADPMNGGDIPPLVFFLGLLGLSIAGFVLMFRDGAAPFFVKRGCGRGRGGAAGRPWWRTGIGSLPACGRPPAGRPSPSATAGPPTLDSVTARMSIHRNNSGNGSRPTGCFACLRCGWRKPTRAAVGEPTSTN